MPLPAPKGGAIIWLPARDTPTPVVDDPMERVLVRGCMSENLGDLHQTLEFLRRYTAADDCEIFLVDDRHREVLQTGCTGLDTQALLELTHIPLGKGYPGAVTARQQPMLTNDFQHDHMFLRSGLRRCGIRSFLGVPLSRDGQPLGYLGLGWRDARVPITPLISRLESLKPLLLAGLPPTRLVVAPRERSVVELNIRALGALEIRLDGELVPAQAFTRRKAIGLLQVLLLRAPAAVHRDELIEQLWPAADRQSGANRLHGVVHALRAILGRGDPDASRFIGHEHEAYFFRPPAGAAVVDLFEFRRLLKSARNAGGHLGEDDVTQALERGVALYDGDLFGDDRYTEWLDAPRLRLRDEYLHAVRALCVRYARAHRHEDALAVLRHALHIDPFAEDLHQHVIRALLALDRRIDASEHYERLRAIIRDAGMECDPETSALDAQLRLARTGRNKRT